MAVNGRIADSDRAKTLFGRARGVGSQAARVVTAPGDHGRRLVNPSLLDGNIDGPKAADLPEVPPAIHDCGCGSFLLDIHLPAGADHAFVNFLNVLRNSDNSVRVVAQQTCSHQVIGYHGRLLRGGAYRLKDIGCEGEEALVWNRGRHCFRSNSA
jgi:hypothetical protein